MILSGQFTDQKNLFMEPLFSIVIPTYNRDVFISRCIDSILHQEYENWEAIIVDDGSTDKTKSVIHAYDDPRINYFYKENGGVSSARNLGLDNTQGDYIAFLDSDDEYKPNHLKSIYHFLLKNNFPVCFVFTDFIMNFDDKIVERETSEFLTVKPNFTNIPYTQVTAIHKDAIGQDRFNEDLLIREDAEFLDRIRFKTDCFRIKNKSVIIHRHDDNVTNDSIFVKKEMEKSIYFYIKSRKRFTLNELSKLYEIYSVLSLHHFRNRNTSSLLIYLFKMVSLSPICLFHYPSLKSTLNRISALYK